MRPLHWPKLRENDFIQNYKLVNFMANCPNLALFNQRAPKSTQHWVNAAFEEDFLRLENTLKTFDGIKCRRNQTGKTDRPQRGRGPPQWVAHFRPNGDIVPVEKWGKNYNKEKIEANALLYSENYLRNVIGRIF
jgi:hypothetical protein